MMTRIASLYAVIGGAIGAVAAMAMGAVMPPGAQNEDASFGQITCPRLIVNGSGDGSVVAVHGKKGIGNLLANELGGSGTVYNIPSREGSATLSAGKHGGRVWVKRDAGDVNLFTNEHGGTVEIIGKEGVVILGTGEDGGLIGVYSKEIDGSRAVMVVNKQGGAVAICGEGDTRAVIAVNGYGNGVVNTWDKNGDALATLK
ncbi:MAG: hypothetical protein OXI86_22840 [Candidatus Poribacteria bacterium]|nr:hypothetical protein [Candidatus Poribacteria bacterium]